MMISRRAGLGDAYYCATDPLSVAELTAYGLFTVSNCPTAYCSVNPNDPLCTSVNPTPAGTSAGLPVGYNPQTGTVDPSNTTGAVTTPTQAQQQAALQAAIAGVVASDPNVSSTLGGAGDASTPNTACPLGCSWFGIGCPTACDPSKLDPTSVLLWAGGALLVLFVAIKAIK